MSDRFIKKYFMIKVLIIIRRHSTCPAIYSYLWTAHKIMLKIDRFLEDDFVGSTTPFVYFQ